MARKRLVSGRSAASSSANDNRRAPGKGTPVNIRYDATPAVQRKRGQGGDDVDVPTVAAAGVAGSGGRLPHHDVIQAAFGLHNIGDVKAHVGGQAGDAATAIGAEAYATGTDVAFRSQPSLHLAAHEAAHVVQQRAGVQLSGGVGRAGDQYEQQADAVADAVVQGRSAEALLGVPANRNAESGLQLKEMSHDDCSGVMNAAAKIFARSDAAKAVIARAPAEYQSALTKLHGVVRETYGADRGPIPDIYARYKQAKAALAPAFKRGRQLMPSYFAEYVAIPDASLRKFLSKQTAEHEARTADLGGEAIMLDDASAGVRAAYLKAQSSSTLAAIKKITTGPYRMMAADAANTAAAHKDAGAPPPELSKQLTGVMAAQSLIVTACALLKLTDDEFQQRWAEAKADFVAHDVSFKTVATSLDFAATWTTALGGIVTSTAAVVSNIALLMNNAKLATTMANVSMVGLRTLGQIGAVVQVVHGGLVLLDKESTTKQREEAIGGIMVGGSFLVASAVAGGAVAAPVSLMVLATWELLQFAAENYLACKFNIVNGVLAPVFAQITSMGNSFATQLRRIANAATLKAFEQDPDKVAAFEEIVRGGTADLRDSCISFLDDCRPTASITKKNRWSTKPGAYTVLQQAFAPHLSRKFGTTPENVGEAAAELVETISWVLTNSASLSEAEGAGRDMPDREGTADIVPAENQWQNGDVVRADWKGSLLPATVIAMSSDGAQAQLHWHGYGDAWHDLWVDSLSLRPGSLQQGSAGAWKDGDSVLAEYAGAYYPATIIDVSSDGQKCRLHWSGYGESWHEEWHSVAGLRSRS